GNSSGDSIPHPQLAVSMVIRRALPTLAQGEIAGAQPTPADRQGWVGQSGGKTLRVGGKGDLPGAPFRARHGGPYRDGGD
ncbi:hypothetical protein OFN25_33295, partial [Escherichia coli]|nr:hypothetical protein [Escherichia coli]